MNVERWSKLKDFASHLINELPDKDANLSDDDEEKIRYDQHQIIDENVEMRVQV